MFLDADCADSAVFLPLITQIPRILLATEDTEGTENSQLCVLGERSSQSKLFQNATPSPTSANRPFIKLTAFPSASLPADGKKQILSMLAEIN